jgi:recombination protein RecT
MSEDAPASAGTAIEKKKSFSDDVALMGHEFRKVLPSHIPLERFQRVVVTSVQNNPELLQCTDRTLWNAFMGAAKDGLLPDGREGVIVVRNGRDKASGRDIKTAAWQPMIAGIRKLARNSGEILSWETHCVFENDEFDFALGDEPRIFHRPALSNRGKIIAAYSRCVLKSGEITREVMGIEEILEIRDRYSSGWKAFKAGYVKSAIWADNLPAMCEKTVGHKHSKVIPMSTDLEAIWQRSAEPLPGKSENLSLAAPARAHVMDPVVKPLHDFIMQQEPEDGPSPLSRLPHTQHPLSGGLPRGAQLQDPDGGAGVTIENEAEKKEAPHIGRPAGAKNKPKAAKPAKEEVEVGVLDPKTGEVEGITGTMEDERHGEDHELMEGEQRPGYDPAGNEDPDMTRESILVDEGIKAATEGPVKLRFWKGRLNVSDFALIKPHEKELGRIAEQNKPVA